MSMGLKFALLISITVLFLIVHEKVEVLTTKYKALQSGEKSDPGTDVSQDSTLRSNVKKPCMCSELS